MVELPWIRERWRRKEARQALMTLTLRGLPHWTEEAERDRFLAELREQAYGVEEIDEDEEIRRGLEALRKHRQNVGNRA